LRQACAAALPRPKQPSAFCLVQELPLGPTGKVVRRRLRELTAAPGAMPVTLERALTAS
jgi:acyl-CoA synthetase (AMP-forming)/AMP-acid ligase II